MKRTVYGCDKCGADNIEVSIVPFVVEVTAEDAGGPAERRSEKRHICRKCLRDEFVKLVEVMPIDQQGELCKKLSKARKA